MGRLTSVGEPVAPNAALELHSGLALIDTRSTSSAFTDLGTAVTLTNGVAVNQGPAWFAVALQGVQVSRGVVTYDGDKVFETRSPLTCGDGTVVKPPSGDPTPSSTPVNTPTPTPSATPTPTVDPPPRAPNPPVQPTAAPPARPPAGQPYQPAAGPAHDDHAAATDDHERPAAGTGHHLAVGFRQPDRSAGRHQRLQPRGHGAVHQRGQRGGRRHRRDYSLDRLRPRSILHERGRSLVRQYWTGDVPGAGQRWRLLSDHRLPPTARGASQKAY